MITALKNIQDSFCRTGFLKNAFGKTRPVPIPIPRDRTGHGILATQREREKKQDPYGQRCVVMMTK